MIADNRSSANAVGKMWNIFFHFFLDKESIAFLEAQCKKLLHESSSLDTWGQSEYSSFLRFCNEHTRLELRRHWQLYVDAGRHLPEQKREVKETVLSAMRKVRERHAAANPGSRSAGPYIFESLIAASGVFSHFWTTGTTFMDEEAPPSAATVNPTFIYSLVGTIFSVQYGTTPIAPFHLAPAFLRSKPNSTTASDLINCAKLEFRDWVTSFQTFLVRQPGGVTIRLFSGDALRFCQALAEYRATGSVAEDQTVAPWDTSPLVFDGPDYNTGDASAPLTFNVVETSNMADHVSLLNVLIAAVPLLSDTHSATLFIETLLHVGDDPTKSFNRQLCADLPTIGILLDLLPTSYPSNFSSRSNVAEILIHKAGFKRVPQYYERHVWRRPSTGDTLGSALNHPSLRQVAFEPPGLAKLLHEIYSNMFSSDEGLSGLIGSKSITELSIVHYTRETFVALLATIKRIVVVDWKTTLDMFFALLETTKSNFMLTGFHYHQELCAQLYLAGIYTVHAIVKDVDKEGPFQEWRWVPPVVSVTLVVPRENVQILLDMDRAELSTPMMQASVQGRSAYSSYSSIKVGFGKVKSSGTDSDPRITFDADPTGLAGSSPLVVSFSLPSWALLVEDPEDMTISLSFRASPQTAYLVPKLGLALHVFTARLMDTSAVSVVPTEPHGVCYRLCNMPTPTGDSVGGRISATMDAEGKRVSKLTARVDILDDATRAVLSSGTPVTSRQVSPCAIEINIGSEKRRLFYPSPVVAAFRMSRVTREPCYIEVCQDLISFVGLVPHAPRDRSLLHSPGHVAFTSTNSQSRLQKRSKRLGISIASIWMSYPS